MSKLVLMGYFSNNNNKSNFYLSSLTSLVLSSYTKVSISVSCGSVFGLAKRLQNSSNKEMAKLTRNIVISLLS